GNPAGRRVFAAHQRTRRALRDGTGTGSLQRVAGRGGSLLRTQELPGSAPRASPPARSGGQPCALVLFGLLVKRAFRRGMARQGRNRRGAAHLAPPADHPAGLLADGQTRGARADDSNPQEYEPTATKTGLGIPLRGPAKILACSPTKSGPPRFQGLSVRSNRKLSWVLDVECPMSLRPRLTMSSCA